MLSAPGRARIARAGASTFSCFDPGSRRPKRTGTVPPASYGPGVEGAGAQSRRAPAFGRHAGVKLAPRSVTPRETSRSMPHCVAFGLADNFAIIAARV